MKIIDSIVYQSPPNDNTKEIEAFVGGFSECELCHGYGEYETGFGPEGCMECCSRLLAFIDKDGKRVLIDWGDRIIKYEDGNLEVVRKQ